MSVCKSGNILLASPFLQRTKLWFDGQESSCTLANWIESTQCQALMPNKTNLQKENEKYLGASFQDWRLTTIFSCIYHILSLPSGKSSKKKHSAEQKDHYFQTKSSKRDCSSCVSVNESNQKMNLGVSSPKQSFKLTPSRRHDICMSKLLGLAEKVRSWAFTRRMCTLIFETVTTSNLRTDLHLFTSWITVCSESARFAHTIRENTGSRLRTSSPVSGYCSTTFKSRRWMTEGRWPVATIKRLSTIQSSCDVCTRQKKYADI